LIGALAAIPFMDFETEDKQYEEIYGHERTKD